MKKKSAKKPTKARTAARKPAPKRPAAKAAARPAAPAAPADTGRPEKRGVYTPQPITGTGWAPFRYGS